jgi:hypothetical protein
VSDTATERDFLQFECVEAAVIKNTSKLKRKYRVKRNIKQSKIQKSVKNSTKKRQKMKTIDLIIDKKIYV